MGVGASAVLVLTVVVVVAGVVRERASLDAYRAFVPVRFPCEPPAPNGETSDPRRLFLDPRLVAAARERYGQQPGCETR